LVNINNLKFNKEKNYLKNRLSKIGRYNSKKEKEALMMEEENMIEIFDVLFPDSEIKPLNEIEAGAFILKGRENSVDEILDLMQECSCGVMNEISIEIQDLFNFDIDTKIENLPIGLFDTVEEISEYVDDLNLGDYNNLTEIIYENNQKIFNVSREIKCRVCGNVMPVVIYPKNFISKNSISGIYDEYFKLSFFTNVTKHDIDEMYPFERSIYIGLLKKQLESTPQMPGIPGLG